MYIKIYFSDKPLFLCDEFNEEINSYAHHDDAVFIDEFSTAAVNSMIHEMRMEKVHAGIFYHRDLEALRKAFWKKFVLIKAAGGLVENENRELLFIYRRNIWDLPKGKLDRGESLESCAIREVKEETGLKSLKLLQSLLITYHTYDESGKHMLKETHWYRMLAKSSDALLPQAAEQISEIRWVGIEQQGRILRDTFPAIRDVLKAGGYLEDKSLAM